MTPKEFLTAAQELHNFAYNHSRLCAEYINQYWLDRDGSIANARVEMISIIVSDIRDGFPPRKESSNE